MFSFCNNLLSSVFFSWLKPLAFHCRILRVISFSPKAVPTRRSERGTITPEFFSLGSIFISNLQPFSYGHHVFMIWQLHHPFSTPKIFGGPHLSLVSGSIVPSREDYLVYPSTFPQSPLGDTQCHDRSA